MSKSIKETVRELSYEQRIEKSVGILLEKKSGLSQNAKMDYLINHAGLTQGEYLEALNRASGGTLTKTALGQE